MSAEIIMGMHDEPAAAPDIYGLPIYRPTKIIKEWVGDEIRCLCGVEMFGQTTWTHVTVFKVSDVALLAKECEKSSGPTIKSGGTVN